VAKKKGETRRDKLGLMIRKPNEKSTPQVGDFCMCPCGSLQPHLSNQPERGAKTTNGHATSFISQGRSHLFVSCFEIIFVYVRDYPLKMVYGNSLTTPKNFSYRW